MKNIKITNTFKAKLIAGGLVLVMCTIPGCSKTNSVNENSIYTEWSDADWEYDSKVSFLRDTNDFNEFIVPLEIDETTLLEVKYVPIDSKIMVENSAQAIKYNIVCEKYTRTLTRELNNIENAKIY